MPFADDRAQAAWGSLVAQHRHARLRRMTPWRARAGWRAPAADAWPLAQVLHAAALVGDRPAIDQLLRQFTRYDTGIAVAASPRTADVFLDDNAWVGLAALQALTSGAPDAATSAVLRRRVAQAALICATSQRPDGGVPWRLAPDDVTINTCSTAPAGLAMLGARLSGALPHDIDAHGHARRAERFVTARLTRDDGCFADHVRADDTVEASVFSYNQGAVIALRTRLATTGDDPTGLVAASNAADAALAHFSGDVLFAHAPAFNAIFFRGLCLLDAHRSRADVQLALDAYLDRAWSEARDERGLFTRGGIGAYDRSTALDQAAMVQLFAIARMPRERRRDLW